MEKGYYIIKMEILSLKVNLLMMKERDMENMFGKMVNIIKDNIKKI